MPVVTCVTPRYLPNVEHLARIICAERVLILDLAPVPDRNRLAFVNRNRIYNAKTDTSAWLTVPINRERNQPLSQVVVDRGTRWASKHLGRIAHFYARKVQTAPQLFAQIEAALGQEDDRLVDLDLRTTATLLESLEAPAVDLIRQSSILGAHTKRHRTEALKAFAGVSYLAGRVEYALMQASGEVEHLAGEGISVVPAPSPESLGLDGEMTIRNSAIHAMYSLGQEVVAAQLHQLVRATRGAIIDGEAARGV